MSTSVVEDARNVKIVLDIYHDSVVFRPSMTEFKKLVELDRLPNLLSKSLASWTREHPELRVRSALGIVEDGFTVGIHVWFDRVR